MTLTHYSFKRLVNEHSTLWYLKLVDIFAFLQPQKAQLRVLIFFHRMKNCIPFCVITRNNCLCQFSPIFHVFASITRDSRLANGFCLRSRDRVLSLLFSIHAKLANLRFVLSLSDGWFRDLWWAARFEPFSWFFLTVVETMFFKVTHSTTLTISFEQKPFHKSFLWSYIHKSLVFTTPSQHCYRTRQVEEKKIRIY